MKMISKNLRKMPTMRDPLRRLKLNNGEKIGKMKILMMILPIG